MNRIDRGAFLQLGITLALGGAGLSACSDDDGGDATSGTGGQGGAGGAGATGGSAAGSGGGGGTGGAAGGGSGAGGTSSGVCGRDAALTHTSGNAHDHLPLVRPITTTLLNGPAFEFALPNESGHIHVLTFTDAHLASLRAGMTLSITSSSDDGHTHTYDVTCA
jgi:hypothetical protein